MASVINLVFNNTNDDETSASVEDNTSPDTGDNSMMLLYLLVSMSVIGMIVVFSKRRKTV